MKKRFVILLVALLLCLMAQPAAAAGTAMTITPSKDAAMPSETVTVTVSLSETANVTVLGLGVKVDSALEVVAGSFQLLIDGVKESSFKYNSNAGGYVAKIWMDGAQTVSGALFSFSVKVKDTAEMSGKYQISGSASLRVNNASAACGLNSATITAGCNHDWKGEITKGNGCNQEGEMTYTCTICGATKKEVIQPGDHLWDGGKVTKEATCDTDGERLYTCTSCGTTKTETISAAGHQYLKAWSKDETGHWHPCKICWTRTDEEEHTPGPEATDWDPQVCTDCGYVIQEALGHEHSFEEDLTSDETGHWYACATCPEKKDFVEHTFDHNCDTTCDVCGYVREIEHDFSDRLSSDETGHWNACTVCGEILEKKPHNPGPEATETTDQTCLDCGFLLTTAHSHVHEPVGDVLSNEQQHWYQCYCREEFGHEDHVWNEGTKDETVKTVTYLCTVCGYAKVEPWEEEPQPTEPDPTEPADTKPAAPGKPTDPEQPQGLAWWWYVVIGVCVLILGAVIFVIVGILVSRKKVGKYSS